MNPEVFGHALSATVIAPDGKWLATDVYLPERHRSPFPALLERTHYGRRNERLVEFASEVTARGWAFVVQDVRGRGGSQGRFDLLMNHDDGADGLATTEWIRAQPWSDGRVSTIGFSGSAANQQALAVAEPPGLAAQALIDCGTNYYMRAFRQQGIFNEGMVLPWIATQAAAGTAAAQDDDVKIRLESFLAASESWADILPLDQGRSALSADPDYEALYFRMRDQSEDGPFWDTPTARLQSRYHQYPDVPLFLASGWFSHHSFANTEKFGAFSQRNERPVKLVIGPWIHNLQSMGVGTRAGHVDFGAGARRHQPVLREALDWIVKHADPAFADSSGASIDYFRMGGGAAELDTDGALAHGGQWFTSSAWPPMEAAPLTLYLRSSGQLDRAPAAMAEPESTSFFHDPAHPRRSRGGFNISNTDHPGFVQPGPQDQGPANGQRSVVSFLTPPLPTDLEVTGPVQATLWIWSSVLGADVFVKLSDSYPATPAIPNGFAMPVSEGCCRVTYRDGHTAASPPRRGQWREIAVDLTPTSNLFVAGHRIRLDVAGADFPNFELHPSRRACTQAVAHTAVRKSRLVLWTLAAPRDAEPPRRRPD